MNVSGSGAVTRCCFKLYQQLTIFSLLTRVSHPQLPCSQSNLPVTFNWELQQLLAKSQHKYQLEAGRTKSRLSDT